MKLLIVKQISLTVPYGMYEFRLALGLGLDSGPTHVKKIYFQNCKHHMTIKKDRECEMRVS